MNVLSKEEQRTLLLSAIASAKGAGECHYVSEDSSPGRPECVAAQVLAKLGIDGSVLAANAFGSKKFDAAIGEAFGALEENVMAGIPIDLVQRLQDVWDSKDAKVERQFGQHIISIAPDDEEIKRAIMRKIIKLHFDTVE